MYASGSSIPSAAAAPWRWSRIPSAPAWRTPATMRWRQCSTTSRSIRPVGGEERGHEVEAWGGGDVDDAAEDGARAAVVVDDRLALEVLAVASDALERGRPRVEGVRLVREAADRDAHAVCPPEAGSYTA